MATVAAKKAASEVNARLDEFMKNPRAGRDLPELGQDIPPAEGDAGSPIAIAGAMNEENLAVQRAPVKAMDEAAKRQQEELDKAISDELDSVFDYERELRTEANAAASAFANLLAELDSNITSLTKVQAEIDRANQIHDAAFRRGVLVSSGSIEAQISSLKLPDTSNETIDAQREIAKNTAELVRRAKGGGLIFE